MSLHGHLNAETTYASTLVPLRCCLDWVVLHPNEVEGTLSRISVRLSFSLSRTGPPHWRTVTCSLVTLHQLRFAIFWNLREHQFHSHRWRRSLCPKSPDRFGNSKLLISGIKQNTIESTLKKEQDLKWSSLSWVPFVQWFFHTYKTSQMHHEPNLLRRWIQRLQIFNLVDNLASIWNRKAVWAILHLWNMPHIWLANLVVMALVPVHHTSNMFMRIRFWEEHG